MTRDEILNMPAGREMDALVIEHIFGYKWHSWSDDSLGIVYGLRPDDRFEYAAIAYYERTTVDYFSEVLPNYSTDISAAWTVVEKMRENPQVLEFWLWNPDKENFCRFHVDTGYDVRIFSAKAETAPLAICRAALLAVMAE